MYSGAQNSGAPPSTEVYQHPSYADDHATAAHSPHDWLARGGDRVYGNEDASSRWRLDGAQLRANRHHHPALGGMASADEYQAACLLAQRQQQQHHFYPQASPYDQQAYQKQQFLRQQAAAEAADGAAHPQHGGAGALYHAQSLRQQMQMQQQLQLQQQMQMQPRGLAGAAVPHFHLPMQSPKAHGRFGGAAPHGAPAPAKLDLAALDFAGEGYGGNGRGYTHAVGSPTWPLPPLNLGGTEAFGVWGSCGSAAASRSSDSTPGSTPVHSVHLSPLTLSQPEPMDTASLAAALAADLDLPTFFGGLDDDDDDDDDDDELAPSGARLAPLGVRGLALEFDSAGAGAGAPLAAVGAARALDPLALDRLLALGSASRYGDGSAPREGAAAHQHGAPRSSPFSQPVGPPGRGARASIDGWMLEMPAGVAAAPSPPPLHAEGASRLPPSRAHSDDSAGSSAIPTVRASESSGESSGDSFRSSAASAQAAESSQCTVKLRGLPYRSTMAEIRQFFENLKIAPHGIRISINAHGRPSGEATVQFACSQTAQRALKKDRHFMGGRYIEVFAHSPAHTPPRCADARAPGSEAPRAEPPPTRSAQAAAPAEAGLGSPRASSGLAQPARSRAKSSQLGGGAEAHDEFIVKMRGLPFKACARDVVGFFGGAGGAQLAESAVHFGLNAHGRPTGEASVRFPSAEAMQHAMAKHMKPMGSRYIELFEVGKAPAQPRTARRRELELCTA